VKAVVGGRAALSVECDKVGSVLVCVACLDVMYW